MRTPTRRPPFIVESDTRPGPLRRGFNLNFRVANTCPAAVHWPPGNCREKLTVVSFGTLYLISEWVIRIIMSGVVTRRQQPLAGMSWLLIIFFQPWFGLVIYLLIGRTRLAERRLKRQKDLKTYLNELKAQLGRPAHGVLRALRPEEITVTKMAERLGSFPVMDGNRVTLISDQEGFFSALVEEIDKATRHVHVLFYICGNDEVAERVYGALERATLRGVTCRLLFDDYGCRGHRRWLLKRMKKAGVDARAMLPIYIARWLRGRFDIRNHRKIVVVDGSVAFTGSHNLIEPTYGKGFDYLDLSVRLEGPAVNALQSVFQQDWYFETGHTLRGPDLFPYEVSAGVEIVQVVPDGPHFPRQTYQRLVVTSLHTAIKRVIITTPYFIPDESLLQALDTAVVRGVRVDLVLPARSDQFMVEQASRAYYDDLIDAGVRVWLFHGALLHSKLMTVDDRLAFLGSSNLDMRSFNLNFEINLVLYNDTTAVALRTLQERYIANATRLDEDAWHARPLWEQTAQDISKLLSPLL